MRLRLVERLGRLFGSRHVPHGGNGDGAAGERGPRTTGNEPGGRHRRNADGTPAGEWPGRRPFAAQPTTAAQPVRRAWPTGPIQTPPWAPARPPVPPRAAAPALPPMPRNYTPNANGNGTGDATGHNGTRVSGARGIGAGAVGRARIRQAPRDRQAPREVPIGSAPVETATRAPSAGELDRDAPRQPWYQVVGGSPSPARALARPGQAGAMAAAAAATSTAPARPASQAVTGAAAQLPFTAPHHSGYRPRLDGRRHCGPLESILWRQWDAAMGDPPLEVVAAIDRLAEFPRQLQEKLAAGLDGIYVGTGGVPDLDHMAALHGVALPSGRATWDACAGAYGDRKIVVGTRPSPTPDVMCHEVGHALDDLDSPPGKWQSDSAEFRLIYDQCQPSIASDFHRQRGGLGRKEFFADSFAAIASAQRPALVDMLGGNTRIALRVMLYFNKRYGI